MPEARLRGYADRIRLSHYVGTFSVEDQEDYASIVREVIDL